MCGIDPDLGGCSACQRGAAIVAALVQDFQKDPAAKGPPMAFGIDLGASGRWTIDVSASGQLTSRRGKGAAEQFAYETDLATLRKLHSGQWNPLTAMGQARASDTIPMRLNLVPGSSPSRAILLFTMSFFTRGQPEIINFGPATSRLVRGGDATVLHYEPGGRRITGSGRVSTSMRLPRTK